MRAENLRLLPRYAEIGQLRAYYEGRQYDGRPDFWSGLPSRNGQPAPLRERKPCIIYPLPRAVVRQVVRFTFGEGKFPSLQVEAQQDDAYASLALDGAEADLLEHGLVDVIDNGKFKTAIRTLMTRGLSERTACAIMSIKNGRFAVDLPHAQDVEPTFENDDPNGELVQLVWCYQFDKIVETPDGPAKKRHWFRRDVTREAYLDYDAVEVKVGEREVRWPAPKVTSHGYGFVPALWIRNLSEESDVGCIDGESLYEDLFDEFDALNFALSQRHRGITFFGTPQPWESGVEPGDGPAADGRSAGTVGYATATGGRSAETMRGSGPKQSHGAALAPARKVAPDTIWSYESPTARVGLLETTGTAFDVATKHVQDIRERLLETMSVVLAGIEQFTTGGGEMNAKFLVLAFAPLLNNVAELRDATWWPNGLLGLLSLALRILAKRGGVGIVMPQALKLAELVKRFEVEVDDDFGATSRVWMLPKITPTWGDAFDPSNDEITAAVTSATTAKDGGLIKPETATKYVAPYFGVDDIDETVRALAKAAQDEADTAHANAMALTTASASKPDAAPAEPLAPATTKPKPTPPTNGPKPPKA